MGFRTRALALIWVASALGAPATAAEPPLTLGHAVAQVLEHNPQLQAAGFDARAAAARIRQQGQGTPWQAGLTLDRFAGTGDASGTDELEATLSLGRVLELGDKAALRSEVARVKAGALRHKQDAERLDLLAETTTRFIQLAKVEAEQQLALQQLKAARRTADVVDERFRAGKAAAAESSGAHIGLARAELALEDTDHRLAISRRRLAVMWGELQPAFRSTAADLTQLEAEPDYPALLQALDRNPSLVRLATMERLADARRQLARAARRPDLDVAAGLHYYNDTDDVGLLLSLKVPLNSRGRAQPLEEEADALARREPLLAHDQRLALQTTLFGLHQELLHERDRFETLQHKIIPAADKALADYRRGYAAGRYSLLELNQAQDTLIQARLEALDAAADHHTNRIQIDRLIGTELTTGARP